MGTQLAAILVTDLVGSTELRGRIGEDAAEQLRREHDRLLAAAVSDAGGCVVKGLGDGVLARFGGAAEAVEAAVAIQRASIELGDGHGPVQLRVGVAAGDVTVEEDDVFGTPVIEASRLCAAADAGQILVADLVRVLSHGRGSHDFVDVGALELKGLPAPVQTAEVRWEPAGAVAAGPVEVPLPPPLAATGGFPFAGRSAATEMLAEQWKRACVEGRQVVLVTGEPGIGKTRLVSELARTVAGEGAIVLLGRCFEDLQAPHAPFVEALSHLVVHAPDDLLAEHVARAGGDLVRLVPDLAARVPGTPPPVEGDPEQERYRLQEAVVDLLGRAADAAPVLLVLDDLHWADASTVGLLLWLVRSARPMRLAVLATYRDTDVDRTHPFGRALAELRRTPDVHRTALAGLDDAELRNLLEKAGGQPVDEAAERLAQVLEAETEGNPFFVGEVLRHLVETGAIHQEDGRWIGDPTTVESSVPEGVRDVVGRRLSALDDDVNDVLRAASVLGAEFELATLSRLTDRSADALVELLVEPCERRLVSETDRIDRYRFAHALVHQTLAEELPAGRRARLHRRAADALAETDPAAHGEIARHLVAAGPLGDPELAVHHAGAAGDAAAEQLAWEDAADWYARALDLEDLVADPAPGRQAGLLLALGRAMNAVGLESGARQHLATAAELARDAGDAELFATAACTYGGVTARWVDLDDRHGPALLEEALTELGEEPSLLRTRVLAQRASWEVFAADLTVGRTYAARALAEARATGQEEARLIALRALASILVWLRHDDETLAVVDENERLSRASGNHADLAHALLFRGHAQLQAGHLSAMAETMMEAYRIARDVGSTSNAFFAGAHLNLLRIASGRFDEAAAHLDAHRRDGWTVAEELTDRGQRFWIADVRDDDRSLADIYRGADEGQRDFLHLFPVLFLHAMQLVDADVEPAEALRQWEANVRSLAPEMYGPTVDAAACQVLADAPVPEVAARCYDNLLPWADAWIYPGPGNLYGFGHHLLGVAARAAWCSGPAIDHLRRGLEAHEASGLPLFIAQSHLELARTATGADAARHAAQAMDIAARHGFRRIERLVGELPVA